MKKKYDIENFIKLNNLDYKVKEYKKKNNNQTKVILEHSCGFIYETTPRAFIALGRRCPKCMHGASQTLDELKEKVYNLVGNEYSIISTNYINSQTKIEFRHNICGNTFLMRPANFISNNHSKNGQSGNRCPYCFGHKPRTTEQFKKDVYELVGDEYVVIGEYKRNSEKIQMQHNTDFCQNIFEMRPKDFLKKNGNRCPHCRSSKGELESLKWFIENNILVEHKYKDLNCKSILPLEFDFKVYRNDGTYALYEYDGRLHFEPWNDSEQSIEHLKTQQENDKIKNEYCSKNNITLIRINYKENLIKKLEENFNLNDYRKHIE